MKYIILLLLLANFGCQTASHKNQDKEIINFDEPYRIDEDEFTKKSREDIRLTILPHLKEVRNCYKDSLKINPELEGKVLVEFTIDDKGTVEEAKFNKAKSTLHDDKFQSCFIDALKAWKFPASSQGKKMLITLPFHFENPSAKK